MKFTLWFSLLIVISSIVSAQTYNTTSQGKNYNNGGAYVAPVVTRSYTIKPPGYTMPAKTLPGNFNSTTSAQVQPIRTAQQNNNNTTPPGPIKSSTPKTAEDYRDLGISKYMLDKFEEAIQYYNKAIELDPLDAQSYLRIGLSRYKLKDYAGSLESFNKAIEITPGYEYAYMSRGDTKQMLEDWNGAIQDYNRSIILSPYASTYFNRGIAKYNIEDYKGAAEDFTKTIDICDETQKLWDAEHQKKYGRLNSKTKKETIAKTDREIEREPMYAGSFAMRGSAKMKQTDLAEALKDYNRAIEIDPTFAEAYYTRALINLVTGNKDNGCSDLNKAAELGYAAAPDLVKQYCR